MKKGDRLKVIWMDDCNGKDISVHQMYGKEYTVDYIDDIRQIHLVGSKLALIPGVDEYLKISDATFRFQ